MDNNDDQHGNPLINNLPDHCLRKIFSYLEIPDKLNVEKVCKRWLSVSKLGWPEIDGEDHGIFDSDFSMRQLEVILCRCGRFLKIARINVLPGKLRLLKLMKKHCYNLEWVIIFLEPEAVSTPFFLNTLSILFNRLQKLETLGVYLLDSGEIPDEFFENINRNSLQSLEIDGWWGKTWQSINVGEFLNLRRLEFSNLVVVEGSLPGFGNLSNLTELILCNSDLPLIYIDDIKNLKELRLLTLDSRGKELQISDHHVSAIARNCVHLQELEFWFHKNLSDACFDDIAKLRNLRELYLYDLPRITDSTIGKMLQIEILACNKCPRVTNAGFVKLIKTSSHLKTLTFIANAANIDELVHDVNEAMPYRNSSTQLEINYPLKSLPENLSPLLILQLIDD